MLCKVFGKVILNPHTESHQKLVDRQTDTHTHTYIHGWSRPRNDLWCAEWDVKPYYRGGVGGGATILYTMSRVIAIPAPPLYGGTQFMCVVQVRVNVGLMLTYLYAAVGRPQLDTRTVTVSLTSRYSAPRVQNTGTFLATANRKAPSA